LLSHHEKDSGYTRFYYDFVRTVPTYGRTPLRRVQARVRCGIKGLTTTTITPTMLFHNGTQFTDMLLGGNRKSNTQQDEGLVSTNDLLSFPNQVIRTR
jgi:hypothetical protein